MLNPSADAFVTCMLERSVEKLVGVVGATDEPGVDGRFS
jgi:hypothetical protein